MMSVSGARAFPAGGLSLSDEDVHVWRTRLDPPEERIEGLRALLCDEEVERAERFHFERHRRRYIVARGSLRLILGWYLDIEPEAIGFQYSEKGKPFLASEWEAANISFNVSHSHEMALYAVGRRRLVGIDVERIRSRPVAEELADRFFTPRECGVILSAPRELRQEVFFNFWTQKEAYLKATGEGVSGLEKIEIDFPPSGDPILRSPRSMSTIPGWWARRLEPGDGYAGAVVIQGSGWRLSRILDVPEYI